MTSESKVKSEIKRYLTNIGAWHFSPMGMGYGRRGIPDIVGCYKGRFFGIEVKAEGKLPTEWQERELENIGKAGGIAIVAWSVEDVKRVLA